MASCVLYLAFRALLGALVRSRRGLDVKDIELLVVRHERQVAARRREQGTITGARPRPRDLAPQDTEHWHPSALQGT